MAPFYGWGSTASRVEPLRGTRNFELIYLTNIILLSQKLTDFISQFTKIAFERKVNFMDTFLVTTKKKFRFSSDIHAV